MKKIKFPKNFQDFLNKYISNTCFDDVSLSPKSPYARPIRRQDLAEIDFSIPITRQEIFSNKSLIINKLLNTIYEQDLLFMDSRLKDKEYYEKFQKFYDPQFVALGKALRPTLEYILFSFLNNEIEVIGDWTKDKFVEYVTKTIELYESTDSKLCHAIVSSNNPTLSSKIMLIQMAPDFLSEASSMAKSLLGSFGEEQSELMKIFIDEFGYGVHDKKHSILFERTMRSAGLNSEIHHYYNDYLSTSLMLGNYFHYVCSNRAHCFKHMGALYYSEAVIPHFNKQISRTLKKYIPNVDTTYFDEHVHIDMHHCRMVLDKIICPSIDKYGESIIDEILYGFETFRLLLGMSDDDIGDQIKFVDTLDRGVQNFKLNALGKKRYFDEIKDEVTSAHIHSENEIFTVENGSLVFQATGLQLLNLKEGDSVLIPKGRLHSTVIASNTARFSVQSEMRSV